MITSIKKIILGALLVCSVPAVALYAATPTFTASGTGNNDTVTVRVTGADANSPISLFYTGAVSGTTQSSIIGYTDVNGFFEGNITTSGVGITSSSPVYVMVNGSQSGSLTWPYSASLNSQNSVMFSPSSITLTGGQNGTITLSGGNGSYYIASTSNGSVVTPSISGNTLSLSGVAGGQSTLTVCPTSGGTPCGTFNVNVSSTFASPTLGQSTVVLTQGGQRTVALSGGNAPYTVQTVNGSGVTASVSGNTLYITGNVSGSNTLNVCSTNGGCSSLLVNVQAQTQASSPFSFFVPVTVGQSTPLTFTGGNGGSFYLQTSVSSPALASLSGNTLMLNGRTSGTGTVTVCQTNGVCMPINLVVSSDLSGTGGGYFFTSDLYMGLRSDEVTQLQLFLKEKGYFSVDATGYFGPITLGAVQRFQRDHGISTTGYVGVLTRAQLNR